MSTRYLLIQTNSADQLSVLLYTKGPRVHFTSLPCVPTSQCQQPVRLSVSVAALRFWKSRFALGKIRKRHSIRGSNFTAPLCVCVWRVLHGDRGFATRLPGALESANRRDGWTDADVSGWGYYNLRSSDRFRLESRKEVGDSSHWGNLLDSQFYVCKKFDLLKKLIWNEPWRRPDTSIETLVYIRCC